MWVVVFDTLAHSQQLVNIVVTASLFGIASSLAVASVYTLTAKGVYRRSAAWQLAAILVLYASTATFTGAALRAVFATASQAQAAANAISECDVQALFNPIAVYAVGDRMTCIQTGTLVVNIAVGDAVVWWRVYMLWPGVKEKRVILAVSSLLLAATFAISVVDTCGACNFNLSIVESTPGNGQLFSGTTFGVIAAGMSLATNAVATCFTAYRVWIHIRSLGHLSRKLALTGSEQILVLIAESGFVYSAIWVLVVVWQGGENNHNIFSHDTGSASFWGVLGYFVNGGLVPVIAIYPMFIIVMVALKRTQTDGPYIFSTQIPCESHIPAAASPVTPTTQGGSDRSGRRLVVSRSSIVGSDSAMAESERDVERAL
ncbi:hypothetical protein K466DRAFT_586043 [Polyporus arcularius HHB13444]|uniref:Uncharacterized protein n=1 Tax=Polyporus arcularius HHB13444 TaxID=1314778 RepID=A0A5C3PDN8_9APHY|nr:hypothetical protein K466DRAFT_586043 [Polyporus arcularius HHB13444]